jgi:uncharacterized protein (DUF1015 family)
MTLVAEIRPFRALRYNPVVAGDPANLVAPPFDVVAGQARLDFYARSPYNISRVDYGEDRPDVDKAVDHYALAARELGQWLAGGVLLRDAEPRLYVYDQEFALDGETRRRRAVFGALRLEEWEKGIVLPHEVTGARAKLDRQRLLEATGTQLSPIMGLYKPDGMREGLLDEGVEAPVLDAVLPDARHTLRPLSAEAASRFASAVAGRKVYVADGHHRYETALSYRDQRRKAAGEWTGEEGYNFVLAGMVATDDPGFAVLPTHRLIKLPGRAADLTPPLEGLFDVAPMGEATPENVALLVAKLAELKRNGPVFGAIGLQAGYLHMLLPRSLEAAIARTPADHVDAWRALDVTVLAYAVLPDIGFDAAPEHIDYSEDARHALAAVQIGAFDAALLLNPTTIDQVIAVSEAGDRMPRKSTFFYPKLATGVVMMPAD